MGLGPDLCAQTGVGRPTAVGHPVAHGRPEVFGLPMFWLWSDSVGRPVGVGRPGADECRTSGVERSSQSCRLPRLESIWLVESPGVGRPEIVGRPKVVGCPRAVAS